MKTLLAPALLLASLLVPGEACAQLFRAYLSSTGNDNNACTVFAPCRLLPRALAVVNDFGEVWMVDSANYNTGTVTIAKSVTIVAVPGALGSLVALNGPAVEVTTTSVVTFRNLVFAPVAGSPIGGGIISTAFAPRITVEDCRFQGLTKPIFINSNGAQLVVRNTVMLSNEAGVHVKGGTVALVSNVKVSNVFGGFADSGAFIADAGVSGTNTVMTVEDTTVANSSSAAFSADDLGAGGTGTARMHVIRSTALRVASGVVARHSTAASQSVATVSQSALLSSQFGFNNSAPPTQGTILSAGNNTLSGNFSDGTPAALPLK